MSATRPETHLRVLTSEDAAWMVALDRAGYGVLRPFGWAEEKLAAELEEGIWASEEQVGWAVIVDGRPSGVAFARNLTSRNGLLDIRLSEEVRGRGVGREVLRQLADHHFADHPSLRRVEGRTQEHNVPMQRAFNAAGFRLEARYRDAILEPDGSYTAEWGYALTRHDWRAGRHRADDHGYDLHGLIFLLEDAEGPSHLPRGAWVKFFQEGRRVLARYGGGEISEGEAAGIIVGDVFTYRWVHDYSSRDNVVGGGGGRVQRRRDGRLELLDDWSRDYGPNGRHLWVQR
ncbi:MAG: GNAT family N-acetyltransferase [Nitriliruptorales bacterium]